MKTVDIFFISKKRNFLHSIRLRLSLIIAILVAFIMVTISTLLLSLYNARGSFNISKVQKENKMLLKKLDSLYSFFKHTRSNFDNHIAQDNRDRTFWQMTYIHPDIWSMGIGGKIFEPSNKSISNYANRMLNEIYECIEVLKGKYYLRKLSLDEIQNNIDKNLNLWAHIPSINPVPGRSICSGFGYRVDPIDKKTIKMHWGVDIGAYRGAPVYASADGVVSWTGWNGGYGWTIDIDHGFGFKTRYAHCYKMLVKRGDIVKRGQVIASVGSTGRSISPHLHYEVEISGVKVNPKDYINQSSVVFD